MIKKIIALAIFIALIQCKLQIVSPPELAKQLGNDISYSLANYGNTPYGKTFIGTISISDPIDGCSDISESSLDNETEEGNFGMKNSIVYLIERGNCSFITKSRNAQEANGKVVMVYNHKSNEGVNDIILMDQADHGGKGLMVSTIFVTKNTGDAIISYLKEKPEQVVKIKIEFQRPQGKDKNKIKFWMSSMDPSSYEFLKNFYPHYSDLRVEKFDLDFTPHYNTQADQDESRQKEHCISKGKYCTPEYKVGGADMYTRDVILEDIRQIVMWNMDQSYWWRYVLMFKDYCVDKQEKNIEACSEKVQLLVGTSLKMMKDIKKGVAESFTPSSTTDADYAINDNTLMEIEKNKQNSQSVSMLPSLIFNGDHFRGDLTSDSAIYEYVCSSFDVQPESCFDSYNEWLEFANKKFDKPSSSSDSNLSIILLVVFGVFVLMFLILFLYRRMIRKEMTDAIGVQVNSAISNYFALNDTQTSKSKK